MKVNFRCVGKVISYALRKQEIKKEILSSLNENLIRFAFLVSVKNRPDDGGSKQR